MLTSKKYKNVLKNKKGVDNMKNKKQTTILMLSLIILTGGLFTGCGNTTSKAENTTSTQVQTQTQKVEDKQEELKKELTPFLTGFANAGLTFDYTKYTVEDYKKIKDFETADSQKLEVDQKFGDQVEKIKKAKGIAKVEDITINSIEEKEENVIYVEFTANRKML